MRARSRAYADYLAGRTDMGKDIPIATIAWAYPRDTSALLDHIAALEAENTRLRLALDIASDGIEADREHLNIAGQEIAALKAENARMRAVVEAMAKHPMDFDFWTCPFCKARFVWNMGMEGQHTADCPVTLARAILASDDAQEKTPKI